MVFLSSVALQGQVSDSYKATLNEMIEVSGAADTYGTVITQMIGMFKKQYPNIDAETWDGLAADFNEEAYAELVDLLAPVYFKYLTEEDLKGVIEFYKTPTGIKYADAVPMVTAESMQVGQEWGLRIATEFTEKLKGY